MEIGFIWGTINGNGAVDLRLVPSASSVHAAGSRQRGCEACWSKRLLCEAEPRGDGRDDWLAQHPGSNTLGIL